MTFKLAREPNPSISFSASFVEVSAIKGHWAFSLNYGLTKIYYVFGVLPRNRWIFRSVSD